MKCIACIVLLVVVASAVRADTFGSGANTFNIEFVNIGNPGNAPDPESNPNLAGSVAYHYRIAKYEVSEQMITNANVVGGLNLAKLNRGPQKPVTGISWFDAAKFVNWLNTSTGNVPAYKFDAGGNFQLWTEGDAGYDANNLFRNRLAKYFLPSANEWYKAAYYDPIAGAYYNFPTGSDSGPDGIDFVGDPNFGAVFQDLAEPPGPNDYTDVGLLSPYGTAGQGGSVFEWEESETDLVNDTVLGERGFRGGAWSFGQVQLLNSVRAENVPQFGNDYGGFRVASLVPEPSTLWLLSMAGIYLSARRRRRSVWNNNWTQDQHFR